MKTILAVLGCLLFGVAVFLAGCGFLAGQVQAVNEDGEALFVDANGRETIEAIDASTGAPNEPVMQYAEDGGLLNTSAKLTKQLLPSPWGDIASGVLGLGAVGLAAWARKKNAEAKAGRELARSIESAPAAKQAMLAREKSHSPELKKLVKSALPKKSVVKA